MSATKLFSGGGRKLRRSLVCGVVCGTMAVAATASYSSPVAKQTAIRAAQPGNQAGASGPTAPASGKIPLRVMLVISDAVRGYKVHEGFVHLDFGGRLARKAERNFDETFASVQVVAEAPGDAHPPVGIDLIVSMESPHGWDKFAGFSATENLTVVFVARRPNGEEIFRVQESASDDGNRAATQDRLGDAVSRKCIQDMLLNESVRAMFSPAPSAAPAVVKAERDDSAAPASAGLDVPPPPPWGRPAAQPVAPAPVVLNGGRP